MGKVIVIDNESGACKVGTSNGTPQFVKFQDLNLAKSPIEHGLVTNWDDMEKMWDHAFKKIDANPESQPVLLTEPPNSPKANREKMVQVMFEKFNVPYMYLCNTAMLSLYASGSSTGLVVESRGGVDGVTHVVPIYEGNPLLHAIYRVELGGSDWVNGIDKIIYDCVSKCDIDTHQALFSNIVVTGGNTMIDGISDRLTKGLVNLVIASITIRVTAAPDRDIGAWKGAAMLAGFGAFQSMCISRAEYDEHGPIIVHRKCF